MRIGFWLVGWLLLAASAAGQNSTEPDPTSNGTTTPGNGTTTPGDGTGTTGAGGAEPAWQRRDVQVGLSAVAVAALVVAFVMVARR